MPTSYCLALCFQVLGGRFDDEHEMLACDGRCRCRGGGGRGDGGIGLVRRFVRAMRVRLRRSRLRL